MSLILVYHTFFAEYEGETAGDILRAVHQEASKDVPTEYSAWWTHQQLTWQEKYGLKVPNIGDGGAEEKLLKILVEVGALTAGKKKQPPDRSPEYNLG